MRRYRRFALALVLVVVLANLFGALGLPWWAACIPAFPLGVWASPWRHAP